MRKMIAGSLFCLFLYQPFVSLARENDVENSYFRVIGDCERPSEQCIAIEGLSPMGRGNWDIEYSKATRFIKPSKGEKIIIIMDGNYNTTMKIIARNDTRQSATITRARRR